MNWLALFLTILPKAIMGIETVAADLQGHQKKAAVTHALTALADGVSAVAPQHAQAATLAASTAISSIDGVVSCIKAVQAEPAAEPVIAPVSDARLAAAVALPTAPVTVESPESNAGPNPDSIAA